VRQRLPQFQSGAEPVPPADSAEATFQLPGGVSLAHEQRLAVERCASMGLNQGNLGQILVLTGGPGTGKTYKVRTSTYLSIYKYTYISIGLDLHIISIGRTAGPHLGADWTKHGQDLRCGPYL